MWLWFILDLRKIYDSDKMIYATVLLASLPKAFDRPVKWTLLGVIWPVRLDMGQLITPRQVHLTEEDCVGYSQYLQEKLLSEPPVSLLYHKFGLLDYQSWSQVSDFKVSLSLFKLVVILFLAKATESVSSTYGDQNRPIVIIVNNKQQEKWVMWLSFHSFSPKQQPNTSCSAPCFD